MTWTLTLKMIDKQKIVLIVSLNPTWNQHWYSHYSICIAGVGQTKDVRIVKLISKDSVEEYILKMADVKLRLDNRISSKEGDTAELLEFEEEDNEHQKKSLQNMIREAFKQADKAV